MQAHHVDAAKALYERARVREIEVTSWEATQRADPINYDTVATNTNVYCCAMHDRQLCRVQQLHAKNFTDVYFRARRDIELAS